MTAAQRDAIYGGSSNAPQRTSNVSESAGRDQSNGHWRVTRQKQDAIKQWHDGD